MKLTQEAMTDGLLWRRLLLSVALVSLLKICSITSHAQDGSLDTSFNPGSGVDNQVFSVAVQGDGKVLIGGYFFSVNSAPRNRIARLNSDGSLDTGFNPGSGGK